MQPTALSMLALPVMTIDLDFGTLGRLIAVEQIEPTRPLPRKEVEQDHVEIRSSSSGTRVFAAPPTLRIVIAMTGRPRQDPLERPHAAEARRRSAAPGPGVDRFARVIAARRSGSTASPNEVSTMPLAVWWDLFF